MTLYYCRYAAKTYNNIRVLFSLACLVRVVDTLAQRLVDDKIEFTDK